MKGRVIIVITLVFGISLGFHWNNFRSFLPLDNYIVKKALFKLDIELCNDDWIIQDINGLRKDFREKVFGQPFLLNTLLPLLEEHFDNNSDLKKPLVLSFHGGPGTGKNFVAEIIAKNLYRKGIESEFYKMEVGRIHFTHDRDVSSYQEYLTNVIIDSVKRCKRSMFVFDEIEKMPEGIFDAIKPFLDFYRQIDGVNFRECIFIFLSNVGSTMINSKALERWKEGIDRSNFVWSEFHYSLFKTTYNENGGLKNSAVVKNFLVDLYLPFLPLDREHVKQCALTIAKDKGIRLSDSQLQDILNYMHFIPDDRPIFSATGCKSVESSFVIVTKAYSHSEL